MNQSPPDHLQDMLRGSVTSDFDTLDYRHPGMYAASVPEGTKVLVEWFKAFCQRDPERMSELMLFPYVHAEENTLTTVTDRESLLDNPPPFFDVRSVKTGFYDTLGSLEIPVFRPAEVGFLVDFDRYNADGAKLLHGEAFFCAQKIGTGKWGLRRSSTMLKSADEDRTVHTEAIEASRRILHLYMYSYGVKDQDLLNQLGWPHGNVDYESFHKMAGSRMGNYDNTVATSIDIRHHSANKAHCLTTFMRRQRSGQPITISRGVYITAKQDGQWRWFLGGAYARVHDYSNDVSR